MEGDLDMKLKKYIFLGSCLSALALSHEVKACTTVVVGRDATTDGSTLVARNEDVSTHHAKYFKVYPATNHGKTIFHSKINNFSYPMPKKQMKYTGMPDYDESQGRFLEAGINAKNVAMSATESANANEKIKKIDPFNKNGIDEASMLNVVLPVVKSPIEGVKRLGKIVEEKGSDAANGIIFSDKKDIWYMEIGSGHQWVAQRVPRDTYAMIPNQLSIEKVDFKDTKNFMYSKDLPKFAKKYHLLEKDGTLNWRQAFGTNDEDDAKYNRPRVWAGQRILTPSKKQKITQKEFQTFIKPDQPISVDKVGEVLANHFDGTPYDTYGKNEGNYRAINVATNVESHILQLRPHQSKETTGIQWVAMASPATSVYVPFYTDINETPKSYQLGNDTYSTDSAYWTYKLTAVLTHPYYQDYYQKVIMPKKKEVQAQMHDMLKTSDVKAMTQSNKVTYLSKQNNKRAKLARKEWTTLNNQLITLSTSQTKDPHHSNL